MFVFVTAVCVALVVSFLCSIFESVLLSLGHAHVESLARKGSRPGKILKEFKRNMDVPIAAILIANTIAHTIGASVAGASYEDVFDKSTLWIFTIVFTAAVLLFTEIVPKTLGVSYARSLAAPVAYGVQALSYALRPMVFLSERLSRLLRGSKENPVTSLEEIRLLAMLGRDEGVVGVRTARMIEGAARLRELKARDVMVPRRFVSFLSEENDLEANLDVIEKSGHSRFPFTHDGSIDKVAGIVLAKDLFLHLRKNPAKELAWDELIRKPLLVPETKSLHDLLRTFQEDRNHLALVVDEYGGIEGIVTMEDVLEEVVGEIVDESDRIGDELRRRDDGSWIALGRLEVRKLVEPLGLKPTDSLGAVSLGGLVFQLLGRPPLQGDTVEWNGLRLEVVSAGPRYARTVSLSPLPRRGASERSS